MALGKGGSTCADGAIFDGFMKQDEKHGVASYRWAGDGAYRHHPLRPRGAGR